MRLLILETFAAKVEGRSKTVPWVSDLWPDLKNGEDEFRRQMHSSNLLSYLSPMPILFKFSPEIPLLRNATYMKPTDGRTETDGHILLKRCENASKN